LAVRKHLQEALSRLWFLSYGTRAQSAISDPCSKAANGDLLGRFREIVSDPINILIERVPRAGIVEHGLVWLHNGNRVPVEGRSAYYGRFSDVLVINRGVHEPLEEYVFQEMLRVMPEGPMMLELGAYWGHYSMWMKCRRPRSQVFMVEPESENLKVGRANFERHGYDGTFIQAHVSCGRFAVDHFMSERNLPRLNVLHSDIQGFEVEMLVGAAKSFARGIIDYAFVSTHSQELHESVLTKLSEAGMRVEISSGFDFETTSCDGFVFASRAALPAVLPEFNPVGRRDIMQRSCAELVMYLASQLQFDNAIGSRSLLHR
jgi:hypothetical protein